jgi:hypothetical protein
MFLITSNRPPRKWRYLLFAIGLLMVGVSPVGLLTTHAKVKEAVHDSRDPPKSKLGPPSKGNYGAIRKFTDRG